MVEDIPGAHVEDGVLVPDGLSILDVSSPSDRAHKAIKGALEAPQADTASTQVARDAAFKLDPDDDAEARFDALEATKEDDEESESGALGVAEDDTETDGHTPEDGSGHPQTPDEAAEAEEERREGMSDSELDEAYARDEVAAGMPHEESDEEADIPNVGSRAPENVSDEE